MHVVIRISIIACVHPYSVTVTNRAVVFMVCQSSFMLTLITPCNVWCCGVETRNERWLPTASYPDMSVHQTSSVPTTTPDRTGGRGVTIGLVS